MNKELGILITTCDADAKHFPRILGEFTRLGYQFVVNFDHCSPATKDAFKSHPLYLDGYENDDPNNLFDETHRKYGLDLLVKNGFAWASYLDTDEIYDRNFHELLPSIIRSRADVVWCPCVDFWGDDRHMRVDGPFGPSIHCRPGKQYRKKFYNLRGRNWEYLHADVHAPQLKRAGKRRTDPVFERSDLCVLHYGIMNQADVEFHTKRWNEVYTRAFGYNKYAEGFYGYINNPEKTPEVIDFDPETWRYDFNYWTSFWENRGVSR